MPDRALIAALVFQGGLIVLAVVLALIFGLSPWTGLTFDAQTLLFSGLATLPLVAGLVLIPRGRWGWADRLVEQVESLLHVLFRKAWPGAVVLVSALAGIGEELLFRGVLQDGLAAWLPPWLGLALASMLFGLAHAVSLAYFLIATAIGMYLGGLYWYSDNLVVPILTHALYDWLAIHFYLRRR